MIGPELMASRALDCARVHTPGQLDQLSHLAGPDLDVLLQASRVVRSSTTCEPWLQNLATAILNAAHISATARSEHDPDGR